MQRADGGGGGGRRRIGSAVVRYTLQSLSQQRFTPDTAHELLSNVTERLGIQTEVCDLLLSRLAESSPSSIISATQQQQQQQQEKNLRHLRYLHYDTHRLCDQVANRTPQIFDRWSNADRHAVVKTLEQVRDRHACSLERWVDVVDGGRRVERRVLNILKRRLGIQLLCQHGTMLGKGILRGAISSDCDIRTCVDEAYAEARHVCETHLQVAPDLRIMIQGTPGLEIELVVRFWLHHALVEVMKNAMKSSVEHSRAIGQSFPSPISVDARTVHQDIVIDIVDEGLGLPGSSETDVEDLFRIGHTSEPKKWDRLQEQQSYASVTSPLSSLGVGLPISRIMMQHFGGNLELLRNQVVREGCTARIRVPLDTHVMEPETAIKRGKDTVPKSQ